MIYRENSIYMHSMSLIQSVLKLYLFVEFVLIHEYAVVVGIGINE